MLGLPKKNENRIVFIGDSITEEWGNLYPRFFANQGYINREIGGQTTPQMLLRFKPDAINLKPNVIVILAGTNDIAGNTGPSMVKMITDNIFYMAELAINKKIKIILSSILPVHNYPWNLSIKNVPSNISSINVLIKDYAVRNKMVYLDYYSLMVDKNKGLDIGYTKDGVHPNKTGYELMSNIATKILSKI